MAASAVNSAAQPVIVALTRISPQTGDCISRSRNCCPALMTKKGPSDKSHLEDVISFSTDVIAPVITSPALFTKHHHHRRMSNFGHPIVSNSVHLKVRGMKGKVIAILFPFICIYLSALLMLWGSLQSCVTMLRLCHQLFRFEPLRKSRDQLLSSSFFGNLSPNGLVVSSGINNTKLVAPSVRLIKSGRNCKKRTIRIITGTFKGTKGATNSTYEPPSCLQLLVAGNVKWLFSVVISRLRIATNIHSN